MTSLGLCPTELSADMHLTKQMCLGVAKFDLGRLGECMVFDASAEAHLMNCKALRAVHMWNASAERPQSVQLLSSTKRLPATEGFKPNKRPHSGLKSSPSILLFLFFSTDATLSSLAVVSSLENKPRSLVLHGTDHDTNAMKNQQP